MTTDLATRLHLIREAINPVQAGQIARGGTSSLASRSRLTGGALDRFKSERRKRAGFGTTPTTSTTRVAEQVADIIERLDEGELEALLNELRRSGRRADPMAR